MKTRTILLTCALVATYAISALPTAEASGNRVKFGIGTDGLDAMSNAGVKPEYTQVWVTEGVSRWGWGHVDSALQAAKSRGVTLVVMWYYWGDSISPSCVDNGCDGRDQWEWKSMTRTLASKIRTSGASAVVIVEPEFNKAGIDGWYAGTFDAKLREIIGIVRSDAPGAKVAIGFGNWGDDKWTKFKGAVGAADYTGFQAMAASTRHGLSSYLSTDDKIESTARSLKSKFWKPVILYDLALATYPEPEWRGHQNEFMKQLFGRMGNLANAGLDGIVWRYYKDNCFSSGYFGAAECYWGMADKHGSPKPAWWTWVNGIKSHRNGYTPPPPSDGGTSGEFVVSFTPTKTGNEWWTEVKVDANQPLSKVTVSVNDGAEVAMDRTNWGSWAKSVHAPPGSHVVFGATSTSGKTVWSHAYVWPQATPVTPGDGGNAGGGLSASFNPGKNGNEWWVEVYVDADQGLKSVEAKVNSGGWVHLEKKSWGSWAKGMHAPNGAKVQFRATDWGGETAYSAIYTWPA